MDKQEFEGPVISKLPWDCPSILIFHIPEHLQTPTPLEDKRTIKFNLLKVANNKRFSLLMNTHVVLIVAKSSQLLMHESREIKIIESHKVN